MKREPIALPAARISATWDPRRGGFDPATIESDHPNWREARARLAELASHPAPIVQTQRRRLIDGIRRLQRLARRGLQQLLERQA